VKTLSTLAFRGSESYRDEAERIAEEIRRTGRIKIGDVVLPVKRVSVMRESGVVSGWNIYLDKCEDCGVYTYDSRDVIVARFRKIRPGVSLVVGEMKGEAYVTIVYKDM
jgi:hypothetical protein